MKEDIQNKINSINTNLLLELPTGYGKTKLALDIINNCNPNNILIVIPRIVLIDSWKDEIKKWGYEQTLNKITFTTYVSLAKHIDKWDLVIFDECHHLSERCREIIPSFRFKKVILLSATVKRDLKTIFYYLFKPLTVLRVTTREAIDNEELPDPKIIFIPLHLDNTKQDYWIIKNKSKGNPITINYADRLKYLNVKGCRVQIRCTQQQYYDDMSAYINWFKNRVHLNIYKRLYLRKCGERLKWLSEEKTSIMHKILNLYKDYRTITFCSSIAQTERLGKNCINSKNKKAQEYLQAFNDNKINHITACDMLNEGINLSSCQVGIFAALNSSDRLITQKTGRLLRHPDPIIVIPYFVNTRDEEIVNKMKENYNPKLIKTIKL